MATKQVTEQVLRFLIQKAQERQVTNYEEVAIANGLPSSGNALGSTLSVILGDIYQWCANRGQPPLSGLVVRKSGEDAGLPGRGFWSLAAPGITDRVQKRIYLNVLNTQVFNYYQL